MRSTATRYFIVLVLFGFSTYAYPICSQWGQPQQIGTLETSLINESSGLQLSRLVANRLYHINDSGDGPNLYITDLKGRKTRKISIAGFEPRDVEAISITSCKGSPCLAIADIGDNREERDDYKIVFIKELKRFPNKVMPLKIVHINYPDRSHNAESLAFTPDGNLFIMTKEWDEQENSYPSFIFRINAAQLRDGASVTPEEVGKIDFAQFHPEFAYQVPTDMDISADGRRLIILNYKDAIEFDLNRKDWPRLSLKNGKIVPLKTLEQQESITYSADQRSLIYETESDDDGNGNGGAEIMQINCQK